MKDQDIENMSVQSLKEEIIKLRDAIRNHRDQRGDNRCWLDDSELYAVLPDGIGAITELPPKEVFLKNCEYFFNSRQGSCEHLHTWGGVLNPCNELTKDICVICKSEIKDNVISAMKHVTIDGKRKISVAKTCSNKCAKDFIERE